MRVCHIWHSFYPIEFGGAERYILSLSDFLSNQDQNMHFLMITDKAAYVPLSRALQTSAYQKINSLEVHRIGPNFSSFLNGTFYKTFHRTSKLLNDMLTVNLYRTAARIRGISKIDVFHVHGFWQPLYPTIGLLLSQHFHRPLMVTLHGDSVSVDDPFAMPLNAPATLNVLRHADIIATYSREALNVLHSLGLGKKSRLIPNFVDTRKFKNPKRTRKGLGARIVMVTRLSKPKDPITPIRAFAIVRKEVPEATFEIVGYGPLYEQAKTIVQDLNLGNAVTFYGLKSDVREFLWDNDICIGTRGSYITTLEAWAAGLVVVAPDFGIMKDLISEGKDGFLTPPGDADQLAIKLISLIKNKQLRTLISENGLQSAEKHDVRNVAPSISDIYRSLL
jgi:glycosyltransferase involved in cell wall biosynthesis